MQLTDLMGELEKLGSEQQRKTYRNHGAKADMYGVKIGDLKVVAKKIKGDQELAQELYRTGNLDAMYLAGLVADGRKMSRKELDTWARAASWQMISEYTVAWVAAESPHARELALEWIDSPKESVASTGWNTYSCLLGLRPDSELDQAEIRQLLDRIEKEIHQAPNRVRYCMNGFVIAAGTCVQPLLAKAKGTAKKIGLVKVDMGKTSCKVPLAIEAITKVESIGRVGTKRKTVKC